MRQYLRYTGEALKKPVFIAEDGDKHAFTLVPFVPNPRLVEVISVALKTGWPLLITGEKFRRDMVGKAVAYELYGAAFRNYFKGWNIKDGETFQHGLYTYFHEERQRDLEYYKIDPEHNPLRKPEHYLETGPLIPVFEQLAAGGEIPILEIRNIHKGDARFIEHLMDFLLFCREIVITETDFHLPKGFIFPIIIMTAEAGYQLPLNYEGVIYTHEMRFPEKEEFLAETFPVYETLKNAAGESLKDHPDFPAMAQLIEKLVELFYLVKDSHVLRPGDSEFPMSILELQNAIDLSINEITGRQKTAAESIAKLDRILQAQYAMAKTVDLSESIGLIKAAVKKAQMNDAMASLELLQDRLSKAQQTEVIQLIARHNELKKVDRMGTESPLILYSQKNKLSFDLLQLLATI